MSKDRSDHAIEGGAVSTVRCTCGQEFSSVAPTLIEANEDAIATLAAHHRAVGPPPAPSLSGIGIDWITPGLDIRA